MKASVPVLAPLLRSDVQGLLLAALVLSPDAEYTLTELTRFTESSMPTVSREIDRLITSGFATERRSGRNRYVTVDTSHPLYRPVQEIVEYAYGPLVVLPRLFLNTAGVDAAYIYGSWAARFRGKAGPDPQDIDVLVVGTPDRAAVFDAERRARSSLRRDVNVQSVTAEQWTDSDDAFLQTVRSRPMVRLLLPEDA